MKFANGKSTCLSDSGSGSKAAGRWTIVFRFLLVQPEVQMSRDELTHQYSGASALGWVRFYRVGTQHADGSSPHGTCLLEAETSLFICDRWYEDRETERYGIMCLLLCDAPS